MDRTDAAGTGDVSHLYLLSKTRMSGDHAELLTYVLYFRLRAAVQTNDSIGYAYVDTDKIEPFILGKFAGRSGHITAWVQPGLHGLLIAAGVRESGSSFVLPQGFADEMTTQGFGLN